MGFLELMGIFWITPLKFVWEYTYFRFPCLSKEGGSCVMILSMDMTENRFRKKINTKTEEKNNIYTF